MISLTKHSRRHRRLRMEGTWWDGRWMGRNHETRHLKNLYSTGRTFVSFCSRCTPSCSVAAFLVRPKEGNSVVAFYWKTYNVINWHIHEINISVKIRFNTIADAWWMIDSHHKCFNFNFVMIFSVENNYYHCKLNWCQTTLSFALNIVRYKCGKHICDCGINRETFIVIFPFRQTAMALHLLNLNVCHAPALIAFPVPNNTQVPFASQSVFNVLLNRNEIRIICTRCLHCRANLNKFTLYSPNKS